MRLLSLLLVLVIGASPAARAQPRGVDLFLRMARGGLTRTEGTTRVPWLPSGDQLLITTDSGGPRHHRVDPLTQRRTPLFDATAVRAITAEYERLSGRAPTSLTFADLSFGPSGEWVRFTMDQRQWLYRPATRRLRELRKPSKTGPLGFDTTEPGEYSPDFRLYAFVRDYDHLWLFDTESGAETLLAAGTGEDNAVGFLGATPWFVWSPDSRWIAYFRADQSVFPRYPILRSLETPAKVETLRYPLTSVPTAPMELWVVNVATGVQQKIAENSKAIPFLRDLTWSPDGKMLSYQAISEFENRLELIGVEVATGAKRTLLVDEDPAYLDPPTNLRFLRDGRFLFSSEKSGWRHLYLHDPSGRELLQLTTGSWVVEDVLHVDEARGWVYFVGHLEQGLERHAFRVGLDGRNLTRLTPEPGSHVVSIDPTGRYLVDDYSALATPRTVVLRRTDGSVVRHLATTSIDTARALGLEPPELLRLTAADGRTPMHGILFKPVGFDPAKRYPVIVNIYGGPHTKAVRNTYETTDFRAQLAQLGFLVAEFDGRGTRLREKSFQTGNYQRLGQTDVDDQAAAVRQLAERGYVDAGRVGVTGLSHGGFMTLMMMLRYPKVFQVGVAGVPLTDLSLGPRQYIGRFMRTPEANPEGYAAANVISRAEALEGRLLIYHGTNDRNALFGNTMQLVKRFVDLGKPVDMMVYPDGVHVLEGRDAVHMIKTTASYFLEHLRPEGWEASRAAIWAAR